jgi:hypothetical protein
MRYSGASNEGDRTLRSADSALAPDLDIPIFGDVHMMYVSN